MLDEKGLTADLPQASHDYLVRVLFDIGPALETGMGAAPVTHSEISAWERRVGFQLTPWEASLVRLCSSAWIRELQRASAPLCISPLEEADAGDQAGAMQKAISLKAMMRGISK